MWQKLDSANSSTEPSLANSISSSHSSCAASSISASVSLSRAFLPLGSLSVPVAAGPGLPGVNSLDQLLGRDEGTTGLRSGAMPPKAVVLPAPATDEGQIAQVRDQIMREATELKEHLDRLIESIAKLDEWVRLADKPASHGADAEE